MPHFCNCGADTYLCQNCCNTKCSKDFPSTWAKITPQREGNLCPDCAASHSPLLTRQQVKIIECLFGEWVKSDDMSTYGNMPYREIADFMEKIGVKLEEVQKLKDRCERVSGEKWQ
jgi:hypothetical protein